MKNNIHSDSVRKNGLSAGVVGVGLAGAAAGAAVGVALSDDKFRKQAFKLAQDAQDALMKLMNSLEMVNGQEVAREGAQMAKKVLNGKSKK